MAIDDSEARVTIEPHARPRPVPLRTRVAAAVDGCMERKRRNERAAPAREHAAGFTLLEMMVVLVIAGLLVSLDSH